MFQKLGEPEGENVEHFKHEEALPSAVAGSLNAETRENETSAQISYPPEYIKIVDYEDERQMGSIMRLITKDLSEPYSIYTYRYFIHNWPSLCFLVSFGL